MLELLFVNLKFRFGQKQTICQYEITLFIIISHSWVWLVVVRSKIYPGKCGSCQEGVCQSLHMAGQKKQTEKTCLHLFWDETLHVSSATLQHLLTRVSWVSQLENRWVERLLGDLRWRLSDTQSGVHLPGRHGPPRGGGCHLCRLRRGTAFSADLQHAQVRRVSCE